MTIRTRKLLGAVALIALVIGWSLAAMGVAQILPRVLPETSGLLATLCYAALGLGWVLPAMPLVRWMQRPDPAAD